MPGVLDAAALWLTTLVVALVAGLVPVLNVEVYLFGVAALAHDSSAAALALPAALGQMAAKSLLYLAGSGVLRAPLGRHAARLEPLQARFASARAGGLAVVLTSAFSGLPPFYAVSVLAGTLRWPFLRFLMAGFLGRFARFGAVLLLPRALSL
jgi:membrane protein YqaA with SNARE-associated domain